MDAWKEACVGPPPSSVLFPPGIYIVFPRVDLKGPCKGPIEFKATGATIMAPPALEPFKTASWIKFMNVDKLTMTGGTYDGQGQAAWKANKCPEYTKKCELPPNIRWSNITNSLVKDVTSANSKYIHMHILKCANSSLDHVTIDAPGTSVNTKGIHIKESSGINITNTNIKTGDACISFGYGSKNVHVEKVTCGPGRGFSTAILGTYEIEAPIAGIWIKNCTITDALNGVMIQSLFDSKTTTASDMHFDDIIMNNGFPSRVKISNVSFRNIRGSSSTKEAMRLACSSWEPCVNVEVADINLTFTGPGGPATSVCCVVEPKVVGKVVPPIRMVDESECLNKGYL
ncbi:hypothetical protein L6452_00686 [Arctium lappa]|uniref:Uncharacterized protein n=1 Tax=Arctium lappa TaxID=4217 RepID=A0ACB9FEJ4_ARCLA|nr:hypothetical protein L6452_00686 [Arctium lappa]